MTRSERPEGGGEVPLFMLQVVGSVEEGLGILTSHHRGEHQQHEKGAESLRGPERSKHNILLHFARVDESF